MATFNKHIVIVGTARSGTSWLSETIARQHRYRMLFEPEQETRTKRGHLLCDQWIASQKGREEAHTYLQRVFGNKVDCDWIAQNSNRTFKRHLWPFLPKKFIIKFVRGNLLAKYVNEHFKIPVIHLIRNPYDVIQSQQRVKFPWLYDLDHFVSQQQLVALIKEQFNYDITNYKSLKAIEILCLRWCIENVIPLEVLEPYKEKSIVIKYEELIADINAFKQLCDEFDLEPIKHLEHYYKTPSSKTHPQSSIMRKEASHLSLTNSEMSAIKHLLGVFKTNLYPSDYVQTS
ncbi:MAG: sulfotransferase domain-containing protein [Algicola sp.]|nr:sulfotransferase domain-containing protein [Algicola sp.]